MFTNDLAYTYDSAPHIPDWARNERYEYCQDFLDLFSTKRHRTSGKFYSKFINKLHQFNILF